MKAWLLIPLFVSTLAHCQEVNPVISKDYLLLINKDSAAKYRIDSSKIFRNTPYQVKGFYNGTQIRDIKIVNGQLVIRPFIQKYFLFSGSYTTSFEIKNVNRQPRIQNDYSQGRTIDGVLQWRGAETNEIFSYGPALARLEYDGTQYSYDKNGRLVLSGNGNGQKVFAYRNSILRSAGVFSQSLYLQAKYGAVYYRNWVLSLRAGQNIEQTLVKHNRNGTGNFTGTLEKNFYKTSLLGSYSFIQDRYTNTNRSGFLNKVYQQSLITPASFENRQGNYIGSVQRSFSAAFNNPYFLLQENEDGFRQHHHTMNLSADSRFGPFRVRAGQSFEWIDQHSRELMKQGEFASPGYDVDRKSKEKNYQFRVNVNSNFRLGDKARSEASLNYILNNQQNNIDYRLPGRNYHYRRLTHDISLNYSSTYFWNNVDFGFTVLNKFYLSNTIIKNRSFLPSISAYTRINHPFNLEHWSLRFSATYNRSAGENPLSRSGAHIYLLQYTPEQVQNFLPYKEALSVSSLRTIDRNELSLNMEISYRSKIDLSAEWFIRQTNNDIYPVLNNNEIEWQNLVGYRNKGFQIDLNLRPYLWQGKFKWGNSISFLSYRSRVNKIAGSADFIPTAGFKNIHNTLVKDQPVGVIMGTSWLRDTKGNKIIDAEGFPIADQYLKIIGDPNPDFTIKLNHGFEWKKWNLNIGWEWKKGGRAWNGTQAMLDYYGRSEQSGKERDISNYIFNGVNVNGENNATPVRFYDPAQPVDRNRWVRYGSSGVGEAYIQKADHIRINTLELSFKDKLSKKIRQFICTVYANNILIASPYKGADPNQLLFDQPASAGLDFFNLPSARSLGIKLSIQLY